MTMSKPTRQMPAGQFKAQCLALLDEVNATGKPLIITKRGKPVARLVPVQKPKRRSLVGSILYQGDLISPIDVAWEADQ